mgnify:CR=1 FL=1
MTSVDSTDLATATGLYFLGEIGVESGAGEVLQQSYPLIQECTVVLYRKAPRGDRFPETNP